MEGNRTALFCSAGGTIKYKLYHITLYLPAEPFGYNCTPGCYTGPASLLVPQRRRESRPSPAEERTDEESGVVSLLINHRPSGGTEVIVLRRLLRFFLDVRPPRIAAVNARIPEGGAEAACGSCTHRVCSCTETKVSPDSFLKE